MNGAYDMPRGWSGHHPPPTLEVAHGGEPFDSVLSDGYRFEFTISALPTGFRLLVLDWTNESSVESDHATIAEAKQHAVDAVNDDALRWEPWSLSP